MAEYRYTNADRLSQLKKLKSALPELIRVASSLDPLLPLMQWCPNRNGCTHLHIPRTAKR
jgi:hypothetical protein